MIILAALGLGAAGVYVYVKQKEEREEPAPKEHIIEELTAEYDGEPSGKKIIKIPGQGFNFTVFFKHKGPKGDLDAGIGLSPADSRKVGWFYSGGVKVAEDKVWKRYKIALEGEISGGYRGLLDALKWVQEKEGPRDPGGDGYLRADWDRDVFRVISAPEPSISKLDATFEAPTPIGKAPGEGITLGIDFIYTGPDATLYLNWILAPGSPVLGKTNWGDGVTVISSLPFRVKASLGGQKNVLSGFYTTFPNLSPSKILWTDYNRFDSWVSISSTSGLLAKDTDDDVYYRRDL